MKYAINDLETENIRVVHLNPVKSENILNIDRTHSIKSSKRLDANDYRAFDTILTELAGSYNTVMPELNVMNIFSMKAFDFFKNKVEYEMWTPTGKVVPVSSALRAGNNIPEVGRTATKHSFGTVMYSTRLYISDQDAMIAEFERRNMYNEMIDVAYRAVMEHLNRVLLFGDTALNTVTGLFNNPFIPAATQVQSGAVGWSAAGTGGDTIFKDVMDAHVAVSNATLHSILPNTLALSPILYAHLVSKPYSINGQSVKQMIEEVCSVKVIKMTELAGAFTGGAQGFIFFNDDPKNIAYYLGAEGGSLIKFGRPEFETLGYCQNLFIKTAGMIIPQPKSIMMKYTTVAG